MVDIFIDKILSVFYYITQNVQTSAQNNINKVNILKLKCILV